MKSKKLIFGILALATILIIMQLPIAEADAASSASDFKMNGSTLVKYQGTDKNVSVPSTVQTIGRGAFEENKNIELVVLSNSVKSIEPYAFWGCDNLDTVVLGKGLEEVGDYAFAGCKGLVQMSIPSNVTSIGIQAFGGCVNLKDITIPSETGFIHETAFDNCAALTIHCNQGSAADEYARDFYERQKKMPGYGEISDTDNSVIPGTADTDSVISTPSPEPIPTEIPEEQPPGNVLGSTQVVGNMAVIIADNQLLQVYGKESGNSGGATENGETGNGSQSAEGGKLPSLEDIFHNVWNGSIPKYAIIDGKIVADQAYYRNSNLGGVALPEGIQEIGQFSFARSSVTSVILPKGTEKIGYGAFYHCDDLGDVMIPESVMCVEPKAFEHTLWVERFMDDGTDDFLVEGGVLVAYRGNAAEVSIPDGVRVIAGEVFLNHTEIKSLVLPDSLVVVGEGAFEGCSGLSQIVFGKKVEEIKDRAFKGSALSEITVPASVKKLGLQAFGGVLMTYAYGEPEYTYETSACRLANEEYRNYERTGDQEPGVTVDGLEGAVASLEGAERSYILHITVPEAVTDMENAFKRSVRTDFSQENIFGSTDAAFYELMLTDDSNIPLTQLGNHTLTVLLPVPKALEGQELRLFTLDRNGQLQSLSVERISLDSMDAIQFQTVQPSLIGILGTENKNNGEN